MILSANKISVNMEVLLDREDGIKPVDMLNRPFEGRPSLDSNAPKNPRCRRYFHPSSKYFEGILLPSKTALLCEGCTR